MPTPPRTSLPEIVAAGRAILEAEGLDGLTMQRVAEEVGVRSPSLYKRVRGRGDLIRLIAELGHRRARRDHGCRGGRRRSGNDLRAIANAFRAFALAHPNAYALVFARLPEDARIDPERNARAAETLLRTAGRLAGPTMRSRRPARSRRGRTGS